MAQKLSVVPSFFLEGLTSRFMQKCAYSPTVVPPLSIFPMPLALLFEGFGFAHRWAALAKTSATLVGAVVNSIVPPRLGSAVNWMVANAFETGVSVETDNPVVLPVDAPPPPPVAAPDALMT